MLSNNVTKIITSLSSKKHRQKYNLFVVEGVKNISEVIKSSINVKELFIVQDLWADNAEVKKTIITEKQLSKISFLKTPNIGLALCEIPEYKKIEEIKGISLVLDDIRDPGNFGTIIRLADWFGIKQIFCSVETVDLYNPKTIMSTMGSFTRVNVHYLNLPNFLNHYKGSIMGAFMEGESIFQHELPQEGIIIMGNEARGISPGLEEFINSKISIPFFGLNGKTESLNVAVATSIILGELTSQRLKKFKGV